MELRWVRHIVAANARVRILLGPARSVWERDQVAELAKCLQRPAKPCGPQMGLRCGKLAVDPYRGEAREVVELQAPSTLD